MAKDQNGKKKRKTKLAFTTSSWGTNAALALRQVKFQDGLPINLHVMKFKQIRKVPKHFYNAAFARYDRGSLHYSAARVVDPTEHLPVRKYPGFSENAIRWRKLKTETIPEWKERTSHFVKAPKYERKGRSTEHIKEFRRDSGEAMADWLARIQQIKADRANGGGAVAGKMTLGKRGKRKVGMGGGLGKIGAGPRRETRSAGRR